MAGASSANVFCAARDVRSAKKKRREKTGMGRPGTMGHGTHFSDSISDPLNTLFFFVFVIAEFLLFLSLRESLSIQSNN